MSAHMGGDMVPVLKMLQHTADSTNTMEEKELLRSSQGEQQAMEDASHGYF